MVGAQGRAAGHGGCVPVRQRAPLHRAAGAEDDHARPHPRQPPVRVYSKPVLGIAGSGLGLLDETEEMQLGKAEVE